VTRIVEQAVRARQCPALVVIDPERLGSAKDPDGYVLARGVAAWRALLEERKCAIGWRVSEFLVGLNDFSPQETRRAALSRAGAWLGTLPARLALEQEDAVRAVAARCGYSSDAVERAFRARYWIEHGRAESAPRGREAVSISPGL
jgi:hypothetical protein